jgi:REP element-mobilizing transposase RayT
MAIRYSAGIPESEPPRPRRDQPWAYFITFACYGARLHGDQRGSVDRNHNGFGGRLLEARPLREAFENRQMVLAASTLDPAERDVVLQSIRDVCRHEGWTLYAAHVRTTHVHLIVGVKTACGSCRPAIPPEKVMGRLKAYASRALNDRFGYRCKRWSRHGSTRRVWSPVELEVTLRYVVGGQGEPMAVYENPDRWSHVR